MNIVKLQDIKSTHRNPLHSYSLFIICAPSVLSSIPVEIVTRSQSTCPPGLSAPKASLSNLVTPPAWGLKQHEATPSTFMLMVPYPSLPYEITAKLPAGHSQLFYIPVPTYLSLTSHCIRKGAQRNLKRLLSFIHSSPPISSWNFHMFKNTHCSFCSFKSWYATSQSFLLSESKRPLTNLWIFTH